jgi:hypothetical protein
MTAQSPVEVFVARDVTEAQFVCDLLADAGIGARVVGVPLGMVAGKVPPLEATPRIWVHADEVERARPILDEYRRRLIERAGPEAEMPRRKEPFCYHCGQAVGPGQSPCPACGRELEWAEAS